MEVGTLVMIILKDDKEILGEWNGEDEKYIHLKKAAVVLMLPTEQGAPQKTLIPAEDQGNFTDEILIKEDEVLFIKEIQVGGGVFNIYKTVVTGLVMPPKGKLVMPFKPEKN